MDAESPEPRAWQKLDATDADDGSRIVDYQGFRL